MSYSFFTLVAWLLGVAIYWLPLFWILTDFRLILTGSAWLLVWLWSGAVGNCDWRDLNLWQSNAKVCEKYPWQENPLFSRGFSFYLMKISFRKLVVFTKSGKIVKLKRRKLEEQKMSTLDKIFYWEMFRKMEEVSHGLKIAQLKGRIGVLFCWWRGS